ncbi:uracil phosphoribosyltransferase-domain-containing protein [Paraphoma chrysanthemicola]|nr:uracil phosphoribosyltransferase-domain-containing protein [Paraphoma chrysanthemicola]
MTDLDPITIPSSSKPTIIGLYGISDSGKTHLLNQLKSSTGFRDLPFAFYDGSEMISQVVPGGLDEFKQMDRDIPKDIVVGIDKDWETYTHMIYLNTGPHLIAERLKADTKGDRNVLPVADLREWQDREGTVLSRICQERGILFTTVNEDASSVGNVTIMRLARLLQDFQGHTETTNERAVLNALDLALGDQEPLDKIMLLDADRTLAPQDTGAMFWKEMAAHTDFADDPLKKLFSRQGYSYASFRQAALLHESAAAVFDTVCNYIVDKVVLCPDMQNLLVRAAYEPHTRAIVVTCGQSKVWKKVLRRYGLSHVQVIGSGRVDDGYIVTETTKGNIVDELHSKKLRVDAFGDSPLDIAMLTVTDHAHTLSSATRKSGAKQILLPATTPPRLTRAQLPHHDLTPDNLNRIFHCPFVHATSRPARPILQTSTRDATLAGLALRKVHEDVGRYLATEYLSALLRVEEYPIPHTTGGMTDGYRIQDVAHTLIIPLMRDGEPMAFRINSVLPHASFAHARTYADLRPGVLCGKRTVILVDSVINSGKAIVEFLNPLRREYPLVRVVVVAGVVQADSMRAMDLGRMMEGDVRLSVVALRVSENMYVGKWVTDTGDRLFGTTNVEE